MEATPEQREAIEDVLATMRYRISRLPPGDFVRDWLVEAAVILTSPPEPPRPGLRIVPPPSA